MRKTFDNPEELYEAFEDYRNYVKENPKKVQKLGYNSVINIEHEMPLTLQGFETFVGADLSKYLTAKKGTVYEDYYRITRAIKKEIQHDQLSGALVGIYNANLVSRLVGLHAKETAENLRARLDIEAEARRKGVNFTSPEIIFIETHK